MAELRIRAAVAADFHDLPEIERQAARRFAGQPGYEPLAQMPVPDAASYRDLPPGGQVLVAETDRPQGFALTFDMDDATYLAELSVRADTQGRGIGSALIAAVIAAARAAGKSGVVRTTFRDVPWNAPFYARRGFRRLAQEEMGPALARRGREDADQFAHYGRRVVMGYLF